MGIQKASYHKGYGGHQRGPLQSGQTSDGMPTCATIGISGSKSNQKAAECTDPYSIPLDTRVF